jgi:hypothetical protein
MGECNLVIPRSVLEIVRNQKPLRVMRLNVLSGNFWLLIVGLAGSDKSGSGRSVPRNGASPTHMIAGLPP